MSKLSKLLLDEHGAEMNTGEVVEAPAGYKAPPTLAETIRRLVVQEVARERSAGELDPDTDDDLVEGDEELEDVQLTPSEMDYQLSRLEKKLRAKELKGGGGGTAPPRTGGRSSRGRASRPCWRGPCACFAASRGLGSVHPLLCTVLTDSLLSCQL